MSAGWAFSVIVQSSRDRYFWPPTNPRFLPPPVPVRATARSFVRTRGDRGTCGRFPRSSGPSRAPTQLARSVRGSRDARSRRECRGAILRWRACGSTPARPVRSPGSGSLTLLVIGWPLRSARSPPRGGDSRRAPRLPHGIPAGRSASDPRPPWPWTSGSAARPRPPSSSRSLHPCTSRSAADAGRRARSRVSCAGRTSNFGPGGYRGRPGTCRARRPAGRARDPAWRHRAGPRGREGRPAWTTGPCPRRYLAGRLVNQLTRRVNSSGTFHCILAFASPRSCLLTASKSALILPPMSSLILPRS